MKWICKVESINDVTSKVRVVFTDELGDVSNGSTIYYSIEEFSNNYKFLANDVNHLILLSI
jgi:hypothetical protein